MLKALAPLRMDVERHEGWSEPGAWVLAAFRFGQAAEKPGVVGGVASKIYGGLSRVVELATGTRLHRETVVGDDLRFVHGRNIRIHPRVQIGNRVTLMHDVTIGTGEDGESVPILEDDVFVGAGAKILGGVRVGRGAKIAANSLVITDVPEGATMMGVPARPLPKSMPPRAR